MTIFRDGVELTKEEANAANVDAIVAQKKKIQEYENAQEMGVDVSEWENPYINIMPKSSQQMKDEEIAKTASPAKQYNPTGLRIQEHQRQVNALQADNRLKAEQDAQSLYNQENNYLQQTNRLAWKAARDAELEERQRLLASGLYYDDGRGNIRLREKASPDGRRFGRVFNSQVVQTGDLIKSAGEKAYQQIMGDANLVIARNRQALEQKRQIKKQEGSRKAIGNIALFDSCIAALDDMNNGGEVEDVLEWGGVDDQGRDARWKYDAQNRRVGQADPRVKNGVKYKNGFLSQEGVDALNAELEETGSDMRITGIIARKQFNSDHNKDIGNPMIYIQGTRMGEDGRSVPFGRWMGIKDLYRFGLSNTQTAGGSFLSTHSEDAIIGKLGDVFGVRKRREQDPKYRESVAKAKLAEYKTENPNWLTKEERTKRYRDGQVRAWDNARYSAIYKRLDNMRRAKLRGHTGAESRQYTDEQIAAEEKRLLDLMDSDRAKTFPHLYETDSSRQAASSSGDNRGNGSSKPKLTREEAIRKLLATGKYKLVDGKVVPK